ncbi:MAG TPA: methyltransferase domain-containing protein [Gaiellaceae bacterium]|nr:methyltransferase domain-containing protein [Gaiellaceae bacterium]
MSRLEQLDETYRRHHEQHRSPGFVAGGPQRAAIFREWVGTGRRVLDLGCRYGALTRAYLSGNEVVGVDVDRRALGKAAKLGIETLWADVALPLALPDASFDVVIAGELLEHLPLPEKTVAEAHRLLRPGGVLVGSVPNAYRLKNRLRFLLGGPPDPDPTHLHMFSPAAVLQLLAGFEEPELRLASGRLIRLHRRLFANQILFRALKPR